MAFNINGQIVHYSTKPTKKAMHNGSVKVDKFEGWQMYAEKYRHDLHRSSCLLFLGNLGMVSYRLLSRVKPHSVSDIT